MMHTLMLPPNVMACFVFGQCQKYNASNLVMGKDGGLKNTMSLKGSGVFRFPPPTKHIIRQRLVGLLPFDLLNAAAQETELVDNFADTMLLQPLHPLTELHRLDLLRFLHDGHVQPDGKSSGAKSGNQRPDKGALLSIPHRLDQIAAWDDFDRQRQRVDWNLFQALRVILLPLACEGEIVVTKLPPRQVASSRPFAFGLLRVLELLHNALRREAAVQTRKPLNHKLRTQFCSC